MIAHIVTAALLACKELPLVKGFKIRLPGGGDPQSFDVKSFARGTGKNVGSLKLRDFKDALVAVTEATLARDAAPAPLKAGNAKLPQQKALRQQLGLPQTTAASRSRLAPAEFQSMLSDASITLSPDYVAKLVSSISGPLPDAPGLGRTAKQPVPYLEAERLLMASLRGHTFDRMLERQAEAAERRKKSGESVEEDHHHHQQQQNGSRSGKTAPAPYPEWYETYLHAAERARHAEITARLDAKEAAEAAHMERLRRAEEEADARWLKLREEEERRTAEKVEQLLQIEEEEVVVDEDEAAAGISAWAKGRQPPPSGTLHHQQHRVMDMGVDGLLLSRFFDAGEKKKQQHAVDQDRDRRVAVADPLEVGAAAWMAAAAEALPEEQVPLSGASRTDLEHWWLGVWQGAEARLRS